MGVVFSSGSGHFKDKKKLEFLIRAIRTDRCLICYQAGFCRVAAVHCFMAHNRNTLFWLCCTAGHCLALSWAGFSKSSFHQAQRWGSVQELRPEFIHLWKAGWEGLILPISVTSSVVKESRGFRHPYLCLSKATFTPFRKRRTDSKVNVPHPRSGQQQPSLCYTGLNL